MAYPPATIPTRVTGQKIEAAHLNAVKTALEDIVAELGTDPSAAAATVQARLAAIDATIAELEASGYPVDGGVADSNYGSVTAIDGGSA